MKRKALAAVSITIILSTMIVIFSFIDLASAQTSTTIYINFDGSVSPSDAPINRVGDLYILTGDTGRIIVERSSITLDGNGHTIQGSISRTSYSNIGGVSLINVQNVTVKGFSIKDCTFGFSLDDCSNITISGNNVTGTWQPIPFGLLPAGIYIWDSSNNSITGNRLENNDYGMYLGENSENNVVVGNTISGSVHEGVRQFHSSSNTFYHNNFDNTQNVYDSGLAFTGYSYLSINVWDDGKEGNFWSDYGGTDEDGNGIGDTPYEAEYSNQDRYPLMKPWEPDTTPPSISIISPSIQRYNEGNVTLAFSTNEPTSKISYSLDGQDNVTISGNTTLTGLPDGDHNIIVYATDEAGNVGESGTVYFSVEVPFPTTLIAVSAIIVAVVGGGLLVYFKKRKS